MKRQTKLTSEEQAQQQAAEQQVQQPAELQFKTVEAMLRHDALHTPVPPAIAQRLEKSITTSPQPAQSWWRRFFGKA